MAQYVLLRIEDDNQAEAFVKDMQASHEDNEGIPAVVGQYKIPTQFCECNHPDHDSIPHKRGTKYGWYLCHDCSKPNKLHGQTPINILPVGAEDANDPVYKDHVLSIYTSASITKQRRQKALALIEKAKADSG